MNKTKAITIVFIFIAFSQACFCEEMESNGTHYWSFQLGYFPNYTNYFNVDGIILAIINENIEPRKLNTGYFIVLLNTFNNGSDNIRAKGNLSIGMFINYSIKCGQKSYLLGRLGLGLGFASTSFQLMNLLTLEYNYSISPHIDVSFSVSQEFARIKEPLPIQLNLGIKL